MLAGRRGRGSGQERSLDKLRPGNIFLSLQRINDPVDQGKEEFPGIYDESTHRRTGSGRDRTIVCSEDGDILRDPQPQLSAGLINAHRRRIVIRTDGGGRSSMQAESICRAPR